MDSQTTVIISPRDRYSGLLECVHQLLACTDDPFHLWILDLGYPREVMDPVQKLLAGRARTRIFELGMCKPMEALRVVRNDITTPQTVLLDNDTRVSPGWLPPLRAALKGDVGVVTPLVLERLGLDAGAPLRNHLYTAELRVVDVGERAYMIEQKNFRRTPLEDIPRQLTATETFELHCVMFATATFQTIELPSMVVREHLDIALQVALRGQKLLVEPASVVTFDNLAARMNLADMRFFFYRWSRHFSEHSARLFEQRWGYRFYSERAMYHWAFRRKIFLLARWLHLPIDVANLVTRGAKRLFCRDWDPLPDPEARSRSLFAQRPLIVQRSHVTD